MFLSLAVITCGGHYRMRFKVTLSATRGFPANFNDVANIPSSM
jgi:hypothetical protein